jgi:hypothetical protein
MKRAILALLLGLLAGSAFAQSDLSWNIAVRSDPVWESDYNFIAPPQ